MYCLPKNLRAKLVENLNKGTLKIEDLITAESSASRRAMFEDVVGKDNAKDLNALFETKMQSAKLNDAMKQFVKESVGISASQKKGVVEIVEALRSKKLLTPDDLATYKEDFIGQRLGIGVTMEEAGNIAKLSNNIDALRKIYNDSPNPENTKKLGLSMLDLEEYVYALAPEKQTIYQQAANYINFSRAAMASYDFSFPARQGRGYIHRKEWWDSWGPMFEAVNKGKYREFEAMMIADPHYDRSKKDGLQLSRMTRGVKYKEEVFASDVLQGKIPGMDESQRAYTQFANHLRFERYKKLIKKAEENGEDVTPGSKASKDIASVINAFSGAGKFTFKKQDITASPLAQTVIWSPKKLAGTIHMFSPFRALLPKKWGGLEPTARKEHLGNLVGFIGTQALFMGAGHALGAEIEWIPISPDFGKIKIGDARYDVSGGNASYVVMIGKILSQTSKSSTTGITKKLGEGYKPDTSASVISDYFRNKLSPVASFIWDGFEGSNSIGEPFAPLSTLKVVTGEASGPQEIAEAVLGDAVAQRYIPLIMADIVDMVFKDINHLLPMAAANFIGVNTQYYGKREKKGSTKDLFKYSVARDEAGILKEKNIVQQVINLVADDMPFLESSTGRALKKEALGMYRFTDKAKEKINRLVEVSYEPKEGVGGQHRPFINLDYIPGGKFLLEKLDSKNVKLPEMAVRILKTQALGERQNIIMNQASPLVMAHELFHAVAGDDLDTQSFNEAWKSEIKSGNIDLDDLDFLINNSKLYDNKNNDVIANERFAYLGEMSGEAGLKAIPPGLKEFYKDILE